MPYNVRDTPGTAVLVVPMGRTGRLGTLHMWKDYQYLLSATALA